jgi:hypothetical protein
MSIDELLRGVISAFRHADVWDQSPILGLLCVDDGGTLCVVGPIAPYAWELGHPREVLRAMAESVDRVGIAPPRGLTITGLVLVSEGYGVADDARPLGYWNTHRIADDPAGYEYVSAIAVDLDGKSYGHDYRRFAKDSQSHSATEGALVDGLHRLLASMRTGSKARA